MTLKYGPIIQLCDKPPKYPQNLHTPMGRLDPRMSYGGESFGVRLFFIVAPIVLGACLIMFFSVDERGHLGEKKTTVADNIYLSGRRAVL